VFGVGLRLRIDHRELSLEEEAALAAEIAALGEVVPRDDDATRVGADLVVRRRQSRVRLEIALQRQARHAREDATVARAFASGIAAVSQALTASAFALQARGTGIRRGSLRWPIVVRNGAAVEWHPTDTICRCDP